MISVFITAILYYWYCTYSVLSWSICLTKIFVCYPVPLVLYLSTKVAMGHVMLLWNSSVVLIHQRHHDLPILLRSASAVSGIFMSSWSFNLITIPGIVMVHHFCHASLMLWSINPTAILSWISSLVNNHSDTLVCQSITVVTNVCHYYSGPLVYHSSISNHWSLL